ncbi:hypothetical protein PFISCL1PPCAC_11249 [Pristionchus fissidentatus]|uniref:Uncharacterized protein n=1 Tax=Pristionchus fissidentatus TaxID=1538716 RepID=A0AAV5VML1_9BILA|nr:hypothetical protein PFISCL1PPCAC_11249 [Pristionchus fissidentatus]
MRNLLLFPLISIVSADFGAFFGFEVDFNGSSDEFRRNYKDLRKQLVREGTDTFLTNSSSLIYKEGIFQVNDSDQSKLNSTLHDLISVLCSLHPISLQSLDKLGIQSLDRYSMVTMEVRVMQTMKEGIQSVLSKHRLQSYDERRKTGDVVLAEGDFKSPDISALLNTSSTIKLTGKVSIFGCLGIRVCRPIHTSSLISCSSPPPVHFFNLGIHLSIAITIMLCVIVLVSIAVCVYLKVGKKDHRGATKRGIHLRPL